MTNLKKESKLVLYYLIFVFRTVGYRRFMNRRYISIMLESSINISDLRSVIVSSPVIVEYTIIFNDNHLTSVDQRKKLKTITKMTRPTTSHTGKRIAIFQVFSERLYEESRQKELVCCTNARGRCFTNFFFRFYAADTRF